MVSCRATNSFLKVDVASKRTRWALGGRWGNFTLYDLDGREYAPGTSLWHGQHNAEWFGEQPGNASAGATVSEVLMFDNAYDEGKSSRMLIVEVDEAKLEAREAWEFKTGAYTPVYGDNDRLPTGNLLGSFWLNSFDVEEWSDAGDAETRDAYEQFDARAMELVRATKLRAWSASVESPGVPASRRPCSACPGAALWVPSPVSPGLGCPELVRLRQAAPRWHMLGSSHYS